LADREGQSYLHAAQGFQQLQVDLFLGVHVIVVAGGLHDMHDLEGQLALVEGEEMGTVELGVLHAVDDALYLHADLAHLVHRSLRADAEGEDDPPGIHALVVVHGLAEQVGVGNNDLLAAQGADPGGLQADMFDGAGDVAEDHEVADLEGLVDTDRHGGEHVTEQRLHRKGDGDAADPEAGDHGGDVHPQVGQDRQQHHYPDDQAHDDTQQRG